jgi:hypothetical protein
MVCLPVVRFTPPRAEMWHECTVTQNWLILGLLKINKTQLSVI